MGVVKGKGRARGTLRRPPQGQAVRRAPGKILGKTMGTPKAVGQGRGVAAC